MNKMENGMEKVDILQNIFRPRWFRLKIMPSTDRMRCPETETMKPAIFCCNLQKGAASGKKKLLAGKQMAGIRRGAKPSSEIMYPPVLYEVRNWDSQEGVV